MSCEHFLFTNVDTERTTNAYFSTILNPGVVFRVPATWPCHPARIAIATALRASVATPDARANTFNAVRSASKMCRHGPFTRATTTFLLAGASTSTSTYVPSGINHSTVKPKWSNTACANGTPASTPDVLQYKCATSNFSPTTNPPISVDGQSSFSHRTTSSLKVGGSKWLKLAGEAPDEGVAAVMLLLMAVGIGVLCVDDHNDDAELRRNSKYDL